MPQTQLFTRLAHIAVKAETAVDTYIDDTAADVFLAEIGDEPMTIEGDNYVPREQRPDYLSTDETPAPVSARSRCRVRLKGSGTAGTAPEWAAAMQACGFKEVVVASTSVSYLPVSIFDGAGGNPAQSYSVTIREGVAGGGNAIAYRMKGSFGNCRLTASVGAGEPAFLEFEYFGAFHDFATAALFGVGAIVYQTTTAPAFQGATFAVNYGGAHTPPGVVALNFDLGNVMTMGRDVNGANGFYGARITGRKSSGTFDPEIVVPSTFNWSQKQRAGTSGTIDTGVIGSTAGNRWQFKVNRSVMRPLALVNREGIRAMTVTFGVSSNYTDVEATNRDVELILT